MTTVRANSFMSAMPSTLFRRVMGGGMAAAG